MRRPVPRVVRWRRDVLAAPELTDGTKVVAMALAEHMNGEGGSCWPSVETLGGEVGRARRPVQKALAALEEAGWIERRIGRGRGHSSQYRAAFPYSEKASAETPFADEKRRRYGTEKASLQVRKGVPRDAQGRHEVAREDVPPVVPPGGQESDSRSRSEDRLAALDIPRFQPEELEEGVEP